MTDVGRSHQIHSLALNVMSNDLLTQSPQPARVLVVDDSPIDRQLAAGLLQRQGEFLIEFAENGQVALEVLERSQPDLVLTDIQMPELDGLGLVEVIRSQYPLIPVVIMTAHGSEVIATKALQKGAASYVPKTELAQLLPPTLSEVLALAMSNRQQSRIGDFWQQTEFRFCLENDTSLISPIVTHLQDYLSEVRPYDQTEVMRIGVALHEALRNAIHHGNLELDSSMREGDWNTYYELAEERRVVEPYKDRKVTILSRETPMESTYIIRDEGQGFDTSRLEDYDPGDPQNLIRRSGRGLYLIKMFMDEVRFNEAGNEITMIHRRSTFANEEEERL